MSAVKVQIERGPRKVWACALEWPGLSRAGRDQESALAALEAALPRYRRVATAAGLRLAEGARFEVAETLTGSGNSDWAPSLHGAADLAPLTRAQAGRRADLLAAAWAELDRIAAGASAELRRGPRGGGRDRDEVVAHVLAAEAAYVRKMGLKLAEPAVSDRKAIESFRETVLELLRRPSDGSPLREGGWTPHYAARRMGWHVLDHAWEIEDKSLQPGG